MSLDLYGAIRTRMPRLPSRKVPDIAPNLKALLVEQKLIPGDAWTEYCDLTNENHDLKLLLARQEIKIARLQAGEDLYRDSHAAVVRTLHFLDPPSDF